MKNIDLSIINVLKNTYPELFGQYFNKMGLIPNATLETQRRAGELFKRYSVESFESFMQRYRNWIKEPVVSTPRSVRKSHSDNFEIESWIAQDEKEFDAPSFLREKTLDRDYSYLDFQLNTVECHKDKMLDSVLVQMVNKLHRGNVLKIYLDEIL